MNKNEFLVKLATANLEVIASEVLPLIKADFARVAATVALDKVKESVLILLDDDSDNTTQLEYIWTNLGENEKLVDALRGALLAASETVNDPKISNILKSLVEPITKTLAAFADEVKPNGDQLKAIWLDFVTGEDFKALVLENLEWIIRSAIKNQTIEDLVVKLIKLVR